MGAYRQKLVAHQTELTRDGKIEAALAVRTEVSALEAAMQSTVFARPGRPIRMPGANNQPGVLFIEGSKEHNESGEMPLPELDPDRRFLRVFAYGNNYFAIDTTGAVITRPGVHQDHRPPDDMKKPVVSVGQERHRGVFLHADGTMTATTSGYYAHLLPHLNDVIKVSGGQNIHGALRRTGERVPFGYDLREKPFTAKEWLTDVVDFGVANEWYIIKKRDGTITGVKPNGSVWDDPPEGLENVVQIAPSSSSACLFLTREGKVIPWRATPPPSDLGRVRQIRAGSQMYAAQREDGTWLVWGHEGIAQNMNRALNRMGTLKDLALGYRFFIGIK
ncbi:MAG: hypothetical protein ACI9QL_001344 [Candidatus Omnitrophota bacterium]|jgi:hypothetical protein